ncbi:MAG: cyclic nucleotide-binding domain-containing protein [Deltaproteobacteria bacterium]|nr:cyclic nucleotide-binding domain-containing protein [Deltaproteobacteria bacterium]
MNDALPTKSQLKKTLRGLRERLQAHPMDLDARMRVARTYRLLDEKKDAVAHYRTVARYLSLAGRPLQAVAILKELLQIAPKHEDALLFLAKLYARTRAADASNTGRVAVPILDDNASAKALAGGMPLTKTGIWRAIRPEATDLYSVVKTAGEAGAEIQSSDIDRELARFGDDVKAPKRGNDEGDFFEVSDGIIFEAMSESARSLEGNPAEAPPPLEAFISQIPAPVAAASTLDDDELLQFLSEQELVLPRMPLFSSLPPSAFVELSKALDLNDAKAGEFIFEEGEAGNSFLVLLSGEAQVLRKPSESQPERELYRLREGDFAGLFALMSHDVRAASVRAVGDVQYLEIQRDALDKVALNDPEVREVLAGFFRERLLLNLLSALPLFAERNAKARELLVERFIDKRYEEGEELF